MVQLWRFFLRTQTGWVWEFSRWVSRSPSRTTSHTTGVTSQNPHKNGRTIPYYQVKDNKSPRFLQSSKHPRNSQGRWPASIQGRMAGCLGLCFFWVNLGFGQENYTTKIEVFYTPDGGKEVRELFNNFVLWRHLQVSTVKHPRERHFLRPILTFSDFMTWLRNPLVPSPVLGIPPDPLMMVGTTELL